MPSGGKRPGAGRKKGVPNKATAEIKALARESAPAAVKELVRLSTGAENETTRVAAIKELLDRGYGKPQAGVDLNVSGEMSLVEVLEAAAMLEDERAADDTAEIVKH